MHIKNRLTALLYNDGSVYRLLLIAMCAAGPVLHYLCADNLFDPFYLRAANSILCLITLALSFIPNRLYYRVSLYLTMIAMIATNNGILLSENNFARVYMFSSLIIFMGLALLCKRRREFAGLIILNTAAVFIAYFYSPDPQIGIVTFTLLQLAFATICCVAYVIRRNLHYKFKKAVNRLTQLNQSLVQNQQKLRESRNQLHALINSINDIVFEVDEQKNILNVWFNEQLPLHFNPRDLLMRPLDEIIGYEKALPFGNAVDYVLQHKKGTSLEFRSVFGYDKWFMAKLMPVIDREGNYTSRISVAITDISGQKKYEQALKDNEALLLEAHAIAKLGNWWFDNETKQNYWSGNLFKLLEMHHMPDNADKFSVYINLVHPDDLESAKAFFADIVTSSIKTFEHKIITPKGNLKYMKVVRGDIVYDERGNFKRISGVIQDITEIRLSEKSAKVNRAELIEAQTIAKIGNWSINANRVATWSDEVNNIYESRRAVNASRYYARAILKHVHPDDKYIVKKLLKSPASATDTSYEYRIITPSGKVKHLSIIVGKLLLRDGNLRKIIGTIQDITERKNAEIEFKRSENKYRLVLETVKLAAVTVDSSGAVIFCNRFLADLLGHEQHEIIGRNWIDSFIPDNLREHLKSWIATSNAKAHFINPVICRDGEQRIISWQNTVTYNELGDIKEITAIGEDITDQQKATQELISAKEDAERSSKFKSEFLSTMSHEIRTPMNAVIGATNLLLTDSPKPEQLEYLNTLKFSGENLLAIINDILDYNKIEAGKLELNRAPVNLQQLTQRIWQSFTLRAKEKGIDLKLIADSTLPEYILADQGRLSQILNNLISNAVKFTHIGGVFINIDKAAETDTHVDIAFSVTDTGIGIAPENLNVIFDPFIQETQTSGDYGGTGLGLAITKRLIELHQSTIRVSSEVNKGTRFTFTIQFELPGKHEKTPESIQIANNISQDLKGMRVLVVDDNRMNLLIASKFLKKWHAQVDEALNGKLAVDMAENTNYDLIIMDLQMPVMDGFEATRIIKKIHPNIPVIALTADAMPETFNKAFEAGIADFLTKPFLPETLFEKVSKHRERMGQQQ
ncbi:PAS domain-containing sensor histidine kinase [Mucilaginibacter limnophilus]|uniref:Sensory/regulatory protein RpfC n=1 Tax=Mucilaginibacter limnophilus TaxID=1932778 RepID=A0A3S2UJ18_9SPHI|nr:PAS domain S-box protein [Mucilaginibacter limnophilus]RVT98030.1 PAS domain-containing sensor histidine kinase [Mucilaginibacter limnophilus]